MPRQQRIHYKNAFYHVMVRGNFQANLFYDENDYELFIRLMRRTTNNFDAKFHLYCLMTNHVHMLLQVGNVPMGKIMQSIESTFSRSINKKYKRSGHNFQGRPLAKPVYDNQYKIELCYYIHNNPKKAKLVKNIDAYPWSSHHDYIKRNEKSFVTTDHIHKLLSERIKSDNPYNDFITNHDVLYIQPEFCTFDNNGDLTIKNNINKNKFTPATLDLSCFSLDEIIQTISEITEYSIQLLRTKNKRKEIIIARSLVTYFAHYYGKYQLQHIARLLHKQPYSLSKTMHKNFSDIKLKPIIEGWVNEIEHRFWLKKTELMTQLK